MSGYKLAAISITSEDYDRLCGSQAEARTVPEPSPDLLDYVGSQSAEILQANVKAAENRQEALEEMLVHVNGNIRDIERRTSQALVAFHTDVAAQTEQYIGNMWQDFEKVIADYAAQFDQRIRANAQETQEYITDLYRHLRQIATSEDEKRELAAQWLEAADMYCAYIMQFYNYEQFVPGRVEWLERQLVQAHNNMEAGLPEVVIASTQQLVLSFSDLRVELECLQHEWTLLYQAAWEAINRLLIQVDDCQLVAAIDLEGNLIQADLDVDYWCAGRLSQLFAEILTLRSQMEDAENQLDSEILRRWLDIDLPGFRQELEEIVYQARIAALNSQLRINIADLVIRALQEQGFALDRSDYAQNDMRMAFGANLENVEGNQIIIQVAPAGEKVGENELHVQSMDSEQRTEHELEQRWFEISRSLNYYGVDVGQYTQIDPGNRMQNRNRTFPGNLATGKSRLSRMKYSSSHGYRASSPNSPER
jgi:hypothetical protein